MTKDSKLVDHDATGRFAKGNRLGRPKGARNKVSAKVRALLEKEAPAIARALAREAKKGDVKAALGILRLVAPPARDRMVHVDLPALEKAEEAPAAIATIVAAIGAGEITPAEGEQLAQLVDCWRNAHLAHELQRRVEALEAAGEAGR